MIAVEVCSHKRVSSWSLLGQLPRGHPGGLENASALADVWPMLVRIATGLEVIGRTLAEIDTQWPERARGNRTPAHENTTQKTPSRLAGLDQVYQ